MTRKLETVQQARLAFVADMKAAGRNYGPTDRYITDAEFEKAWELVTGSSST